jgi:hypothetical protein
LAMPASRNIVAVATARRFTMFRLADAERSLGDLTRDLRRPSTRPDAPSVRWCLFFWTTCPRSFVFQLRKLASVLSSKTSLNNSGMAIMLLECGKDACAALQDKLPTLGQGRCYRALPHRFRWHSEVCHSEPGPGRHCSTVGICFAGPRHGSPQPPNAVLAEQAAEIKSLKEEVDMMREVQAARRMARAPPAQTPHASLPSARGPTARPCSIYGPCHIAASTECGTLAGPCLHPGADAANGSHARTTQTSTCTNARTNTCMHARTTQHTHDKPRQILAKPRETSLAPIAMQPTGSPTVQLSQYPSILPTFTCSVLPCADPEADTIAIAKDVHHWSSSSLHVCTDDAQTQAAARGYMYVHKEGTGPMPLQAEVIPVAHHSAADRSSPHRKDYGVFFCTRTHARTHMPGQEYVGTTSAPAKPSQDEGEWDVMSNEGQVLPVSGDALPDLNRACHPEVVDSSFYTDER